MVRVDSARLVRWAGFAGILAGVALALAQLGFWLVVPDSDAVREERRTAVFGTAVLWLTAYVLLAPAVAGIYSQVYRRVGAFGGTGAVMAVLGAVGLACHAFFLFPELIGFRPDSFDDAQIAVTLEAIGELGAASLVAGLFLLGLTMTLTRAFLPPASVLLVAGALVAPFGLVDLGWLALGGCMVGAAVAWMGYLLAGGRAPATRPAREAWPRSSRPRQFRF